MRHQYSDDGDDLDHCHALSFRHVVAPLSSQPAHDEPAATFTHTPALGGALVGFAACVAIIGDVLYYSCIPQLIGNSAWLYIVGGLTCVSLAIIAVWSMSHMNEGDWEEVMK